MSTDGGKHCIFGVDDFGVDVDGVNEQAGREAGRFGVEGVEGAISVAVAATVVAVEVAGNAAIVVILCP